MKVRLDASVPQRPLAGFPIVSSDMMRPEGGTGFGTWRRGPFAFQPTHRGDAIDPSQRTTTGIRVGTPYTEKHGHLSTRVGSHRAWLRASAQSRHESSLCRRPKINRDNIVWKSAF